VATALFWSTAAYFQQIGDQLARSIDSNPSGQPAVTVYSAQDLYLWSEPGTVWVPAEGAELERLLHVLADAGVEADDVRVIRPFRAVIRGCRGVARSVFGPRFAGKNVGTVHTVQGREADVVVLVLGSAADAIRARRWAAEKPNLLNVAVSRARRRIYVIGDRSRWEDLRYFDVLAGTLRPNVGCGCPKLCTEPVTCCFTYVRSPA
jgi:hypothetical protein